MAESVTFVEWGGLVAGELPERLAVTLEPDPADELAPPITIERRTAPAGRACRQRSRPTLLAGAA